MDNVLRFRRPRRVTIRGHAREMLTEALRSVRGPAAVVVVVLGENGDFAVKTANDANAIKDFDMYSRAGAICDSQRMRLIE
jgi:hypothetical protein